jgi:ubiquinone/menaquinone biosynthesis C-methylase UbiE
MESKTKGSFEGWNEVWSTQSEKELLNPMYTESSPNTIYQFWQKGYANDLLAMIKNKNFTSFCELGSGRGTTTMYLAKAGYTDLTMVDLAEQGFEVARYSFEKYKLPIPKMILEDVEKTSIPTNTFDCVYNIGLLEHFDDPKPTLAESYRLLNKGGLIYMPIVPTQPLYKSFFQRLLFNPLALAKLIVKSIIRPASKGNNINRTDYRRAFYSKICKEIGYKNIQCIPYNPYWKVNNDGPVENKFTLPIYQWYYNSFKKNKTLSFKTSTMFDLCFLLVAEK